MATFRPYIITFLIVGLFMFSMISFVTNLQSENNAVVTLANDPTVINITGSLTSELEAFETLSNNQRESFDSETPSTSFGELIFESITNVGRVIGGVGTTFYAIIATASLAIGINPLVINVIGGIIIITIVLLAWRLYRTGE